MPYNGIISMHQLEPMDEAQCKASFRRSMISIARVGTMMENELLIYFYMSVGTKTKFSTLL